MMKPMYCNCGLFIDCSYIKYVSSKICSSNVHINDFFQGYHSTSFSSHCSLWNTMKNTFLMILSFIPSFCSRHTLVMFFFRPHFHCPLSKKVLRLQSNILKSGKILITRDRIDYSFALLFKRWTRSLEIPNSVIRI